MQNRNNAERSFVLLSVCIKQLPASTEFKVCLKVVYSDRFYLVNSDRKKKAIYTCMPITDQIKIVYMHVTTHRDT